MHTINFKINTCQFDLGYYITMNFDDTSLYKNSKNIIRYLNIDVDSFSNTLRLYDGIYGCTGLIYGYNTLLFRHKERAELFIKEYLEPLLVAKQLSI